MAEIGAQATEQGTILSTVTSDAGQQDQAELSSEKARFESAARGPLLAARVRQIEAALASAARPAS
jgi:hypothetical protein